MEKEEKIRPSMMMIWTKSRKMTREKKWARLNRKSKRNREGGGGERGGRRGGGEEGRAGEG